MFKYIGRFLKDNWYMVVIGMLGGYIIYYEVGTNKHTIPINMPSIQIEGFNYRKEKSNKFILEEL